MHDFDVTEEDAIMDPCIEHTVANCNVKENGSEVPARADESKVKQISSSSSSNDDNDVPAYSGTVQY